MAASTAIIDPDAARPPSTYAYPGNHLDGGDGLESGRRGGRNSGETPRGGPDDEGHEVHDDRSRQGLLPRSKRGNQTTSVFAESLVLKGTGKARLFLLGAERTAGTNALSNVLEVEIAFPGTEAKRGD